MKTESNADMKKYRSIFIGGALIVAAIGMLVFSFVNILEAATTFDSDIIPSIPDSYSIGASGQGWRSVNSILYFSGGYVGIGTPTPTRELEVNGGVRLNTTAAKPACDATQRGTVWVTLSGSLIKDKVEVCVKNAAEAYFWATVY